MAYRKTRLPNGMTIISESMPWVRSISMGFWFRVGSRDEAPGQAGLTHFMEHMMFKGTSRMDAIQISEAFDALGAESNAFTAKEYTCYYARFVDERLDEVLSLLSDMVMNSTFRDEDIQVEREVVLEEIASSEDEPDDHVFEMFMDALMPTHPLGRPVLGVPELVSAYSHDDCVAFHKEHYGSGNLVVSAVGNVDHDVLVRKVEAALGDMRVSDREVRTPIAHVPSGGFVSETRDIEQAHVVYGFPWYAADSADRFAGSLLCALLGGSSSSRLFQEVREKNGLAYSIMSGASVYGDAGQFYVYCGTRPDKLERAMKIIRAELARIAEEAPTADEVHRACEVICSQLLLGVESTSDRMVRLGRRETMGLEQVEVERLIECYRDVKPGDIRDVACRYLSGPATAAVVSPFAEAEARAIVFA